MLIFGLLFPTLFGFIISLLIVSDIPVFERVSIAYGLGFGLLTLAMFFLDVAGIKFSLINIVILTSGLMVLSLIYLLARGRISYPSWGKLNVFKGIKQIIFSLSLFEGIIVGLLIFFLLANIVISLYWPAWEYDALYRYDFRARVFAKTESILEAARTITILSPEYFLTYPPLASLASTWLYLCDWTTPKIFYPLLFISLVFISYYSLRDYTLRHHALLFTLLIVTSPRIYLHANSSLVSFPFTFYFAAGIMYLYRWTSCQKRGFLTLAGIFFALFAWTRQESILFFLGSLVVLIIFSIRRRRFFAPILFALLYFSVQPLWKIYLANLFHSQYTIINTIVPSSSFIPEVSGALGLLKSFFDFAQWRKVFAWMRFWIVFKHREVFYSLILITLLCIDRVRKHLSLFLLVYLNLILFILASYVVLMTWHWWKGAGVSAQRFFIIFPPIMWYFMGLVTARKKAGSVARGK